MKYLTFLFILTTFLSCTSPDSPPAAVQVAPQRRIISTLPSITEVLFDIGLGNRIVGDSSFTKYPPEAANIDKIGGLFDMNHEKIVSLKPDLIVMSVENQTLPPALSVPVLIVDHRTLDGVLNSYLIIGKFFGADILAAAEQKQQELISKLNDVTVSMVKGQAPIRTLVCIDRSYGTGRIQNMFVAGADSFLSEAVKRAGGINVAESIGLLAPMLSAEGVIGLTPDVIIDIQVNGTDTAQSVADWQSLGNSVPAVKNRRILTLTDDFATIPGPRTPILIEKIARCFESIEP